MAVRVVLFPLAAAVLAATVAGLFGRVLWVFDLAANFRMQLLVLAAGVLLLLALTRSVIGSLVAGIAVVINLWAVVPVAFGEQPAARPESPQLVVGHLNLQDRSGDPKGFVRWIGEQRPDAFVVLEASNWTDRIVATGVPGYSIVRVPDEPRADVLVLTRVPLEAVATRDPKLPEVSVELRLRLGQRTTRVLALHTVSPIRPSRAERRDEALEAAARWARRAREPVMVLGDFNATPWSVAFKDLLRDGRLRNSLEGFGYQATWPRARVPFGIPIDHCVFSRQLTALDRITGPGFGSSHRSLLVTVAYAG